MGKFGYINVHVDTYFCKTAKSEVIHKILFSQLSKFSNVLLTYKVIGKDTEKNK